MEKITNVAKTEQATTTEQTAQTEQTVQATTTATTEQPAKKQAPAKKPAAKKPAAKKPAAKKPAAKKQTAPAKTEQTRAELVLRVQESAARLGALMEAEHVDMGAVSVAKDVLSEHVKRLNVREQRDACDVLLTSKTPVKAFFDEPMFARTTCNVVLKNGSASTKVGAASERIPLIAMLARARALGMTSVPSVASISGLALEVAEEINSCVFTDFSGEVGGSTKRISASLARLFDALGMKGTIILRKADARYLKTMCIEKARDLAHYRKATAEKVLRLLPDVVVSIRKHGYIAEERG